MSDEVQANPRSNEVSTEKGAAETSADIAQVNLFVCVATQEVMEF